MLVWGDTLKLNWTWKTQSHSESLKMSLSRTENLNLEKQLLLPAFHPPSFQLLFYYVLTSLSLQFRFSLKIHNAKW